MTAKTPHIVLVGCGKMGSALLQSWIANGIKSEYTVIDPSSLQLPKNVTHVKTADEAAAQIKQAAILILAVKPQSMQDACKPLTPLVSKDTVILSIAAGRSIKSIESCFAPATPVIRAMPNTPAAIGQGITVAVANAVVLGKHRAFADELLKTTGEVEWVENETFMDAVTALSGSGPAYVFYLIEVLAKAGEEAGLPKDLAEKLARQTVIGSGALAAHDAETSADILRKNVTSPGGTTEAALKVLMNGELEKLFVKAIAAAKKRGEELNS